jgi:energy-coupling factor transporter ATP-binding protein EcfA2
VTNPFLVPGLDEDPTRPLCPWDEDMADHVGYYVAVDHTAESFTDFTSQMANPDALRKNGRLVLVAGQGGCGKTSLMNRCAHWLREEMKASHKITVEVIDLTKASSATDTVPDRMTQASRRLADEIRLSRVVSGDDALAGLAASRDRVGEFYPLLSRALNEKMVLAVLLPPVDLVVQTEEIMQEIAQYRRLVDGKLVMFIEVTLADDQVDRLAATGGSVGARPLVLPVRPLKDGDGTVFSDVRLALHRPGVFPELTQEAKEKIDDIPNISVSFLQNLLYNVYEERRKDNKRYTAGDQVTYADITDYVYRNSDFPKTSFR